MSIDVLIDKVKGLPKEVWWKLLSYLISAFIFVPNITMYLFLIYMAEYNFFSYDFFIDGIFGMKLFFLTTSIFLIFTSVVIYGPALLYQAKKNGVVIGNKTFFVSCLITFIILLTLTIMFVNEGDYKRALFVLAICGLIIIHLSILLFYKAKSQFISLVMITFGIFFLSFNYSEQSAQTISIGLKTFGVGGDLPITITDAQSGNKTEGKLKLISPNNIYFTPDNNEGIATYSLSNVGWYVVGKK